MSPSCIAIEFFCIPNENWKKRRGGRGKLQKKKCIRTFEALLSASFRACPKEIPKGQRSAVDQSVGFTILLSQKIQQFFFFFSVARGLPSWPRWPAFVAAFEVVKVQKTQGKNKVQGDLASWFWGGQMPKRRVKKLLVDFRGDPLVSQHRWFGGTLVANPTLFESHAKEKSSFFLKIEIL